MFTYPAKIERIWNRKFKYIHRIALILYYQIIICFGLRSKPNLLSTELTWYGFFALYLQNLYNNGIIVPQKQWQKIKMVPI